MNIKKFMAIAVVVLCVGAVRAENLVSPVRATCQGYYHSGSDVRAAANAIDGSGCRPSP